MRRNAQSGEVRRRPGGLWRDREFLKLWLAQTVSQFGSQVSLLALPLVAAVSLDATAAEMGLLAAAATLPTLALSLLTGVWVDRLPRRPLMISADLGRAATLLLVPLLWWLGELSMGLLYVVVVATAALALLYDLAYQSYLPSLVRRKQLVEGNSKLQSSQSAALILGPGLAGALVQALGAASAIVLDALSFVFSAVTVRRIRRSEGRHEPTARRSTRHEIGEGLRTLFRNPLLRRIVTCNAVLNFTGTLFTAVYLLYLVRDVGLQAGQVGLVLGVGGVGFLAGALGAPRLAQRVGTERLITLALMIGGLGWLLVPAAGGSLVSTLALLALARIMSSLGAMAYDISAVTLRQSVTPAHVLGRVLASSRFVGAGVAPLGALVGGALGATLGLRQTLALAAAARLVLSLAVWLAPGRQRARLRSTREIDHTPQDYGARPNSGSQHEG